MTKVYWSFNSKSVSSIASSFVEPEILELDEETVTEFEKAYEPLRLYDRILKENFRKKEHILSPEMEAEKRASWEEISIAEHVAMYEQQGNSRKDAMKLAAKDRGVSKRDIYKALLDGEGSAE